MKIIRHIAPDMRQAMRAIRAQLGEDAVILSSRRIAEGVESRPLLTSMLPACGTRRESFSAAPLPAPQQTARAPAPPAAATALMPPATAAVLTASQHAPLYATAPCRCHGRTRSREDGSDCAAGRACLLARGELSLLPGASACISFGRRSAHGSRAAVRPHTAATSRSLERCRCWRLQSKHRLVQRPRSHHPPRRPSRQWPQRIASRLSMQSIVAKADLNEAAFNDDRFH